MISITARIAPRVGSDWSQALALSAVGKPATTTGAPGQRRVIGLIKAARVSELGELVLEINVEDGISVNGSVRMEIAHNLAEKTERLLSVAIDPDAT